MDPSKNKIAAETLSESTNNENMRRMKVNAQVTAVTSMLEVFGNIFQWIVWTVWTKFAGYGTLIQSILLYFVILPYAFLMNTSQNKNRIIEDGWMNVLKNVVGTSYQDLMTVRKKTRNERQTKVKPILPSPRKFPIMSQNVVKPCNQEIPVVSTNSTSSHKNKNIVEIFTICENKTFEHSMQENIEMQTINVPFDVQPCSSLNEYDHLVDSVRLKASKFENEITWNNVRLEMINELHTSVQDEHIYIDNFKWFIRFEESAKTNSESLELFNERMQSKAYCAKNGNNKCIKSYKGKASTKQVYLDTKSNEQRINNLKFHGEYKCRLHTRNEMINLLLKHCKCNDQDAYNDCLEIFIDMEEDFVA